MPLLAHSHRFLIVVPAALLAFAIEAWLLHRRGRRHDWHESLASLAVAVGHRLGVLLGGGIVALVWMKAWTLRLFTVPLDTAWGWLLLFLASEFAYYWQHRLAHTSHWFWATHRVHHTPVQMDLAAAIRLGWTGSISGAWLLYVPLPLLGFDPRALALMLGLSLFYQFWLHTELVPPLGPLEHVFNTPARHRVHHASNPRYLDRNFGGVLIVFDRLFNTAAVEDPAEPCRYGLSKPMDTRNPLLIALGGWVDLWQALRGAYGFAGRLRALFGPPGVTSGTAMAASATHASTPRSANRSPYQHPETLP